MPGSTKGGFSGRLLAPQPLADNDEQEPEPVTKTLKEPSAPAQARSPRPQARERRAAPPPMPPAATTIRLRPAAAEPLNAAWLNERRLRDPKLSYPEFASMIVRLGLEAWEKQQNLV